MLYFPFIIIMKANGTASNHSNSLSKRNSVAVTKITEKTAVKSNSLPTESKQLPMNAISKDNYDIMDKKFNITNIEPLEIKYVLKCVKGLYLNRFLYITTHKEGEVIGSGDAKLNGLTLQVEGVGLAEKHVKLKFNGFKKFYVKDYGSESGTWMNIPKEGTAIKHNDVYLIGDLQLKFQHGQPSNQIEELCLMYDANSIADTLLYNKITDIPTLYKANYQNYKGYPFEGDAKLVKLLSRMCAESKDWYNEDRQYNVLNMYYLNEELSGLSEEVGWSGKKIYGRVAEIFEQDLNSDDECLAEIFAGSLKPRGKIFTKILPEKNNQLFLHDQIKIGDLMFELNRFNVGVGEDIGFRECMEDCYIIEEDVGGSEWKLISLFAVVDGYGGPECMQFIKRRLVRKVREWTPLLDEAGDLNQMLKLLMSKTFFEIDFQFYEQYKQLALTCGATLVCMLIIDSKAYVFNLGDSKGYIHRSDRVYQLTIDHIPSRIDEKARIEQAGGVIQYNRLMGKCTLSRAMGQFEYKDLQDYKANMKGKIKSFLSCIPEAICFDIQPDCDDYILLTTDGILDALNISMIVLLQLAQNNFILDKIGKLETEQNPSKIISSLMENSKITRPDCDNMAAILMFLKKGKIGLKNSF